MIVFLLLKFMHLFVAHFIILYGKYYQKKNEASFELIFQNCFINIEQYSGISYHYDYYFFMKLILPWYDIVCEHVICNGGLLI